MTTASTPNQPSIRVISGTVENRVVDVSQRPASIVGQAVYARAQQGSVSTDAVGSVIALSGVVDVQGSGSAGNEYAGLFAAVRCGTQAKPTSGRVWVADTGGHGPIGQQADLLTGITSFLNNYHPSSPKAGPAVAFTAVTKQGAGPAAQGAGHDKAPTSPLDYGFAVVGKSSGGGCGWRVGFRAGGYASGWMQEGDRTILGKGVEVTDHSEVGIHVHSPHVEGAPAAVFDGAVVVDGRDLLAEIDELKQELAHLRQMLHDI